MITKAIFLGHLFFQEELNQHRDSELSDVRQLKACQSYRSVSEMLEIKKKVEKTKQLIQSLPMASASSSTASAAAHTAEFECLVCMLLPPNVVFICTECEGTLCESCKTQLEHNHDKLENDTPLNCPQCRTPFVEPGNPIRSRKTERLIQSLLQQ